MFSRGPDGAVGGGRTGGGPLHTLPATGSVLPVTTSSLDHSGGSAGGGGGRQRLCSQCGKTGHLAASCFEVIRFPEWYPRGGGGRLSGRRGCGGRSGGAPVQANVAAAAVQVRANSNAGLASSDRVLSGLTDEQWTQLDDDHPVVVPPAVVVDPPVTSGSSTDRGGSSVSFQAESYVTYKCTGSNYTQNSSFEKDLNCLMDDLKKINGPDNGGFRKASSGQAYGLAQCRGDVGPDDCHACVSTATSNLMKTQCPGKRRGISWYDDKCYVKYSDSEFFRRVDTENSLALVNVKSASHAEKFNKTAVELLEKLAENGKTEMFAESTVELPEKESGNKTLYGMAQCTMDLSSEQCTSCLNEAVSALSACCTRKVGGRVYYGSCVMRYEIYPFLGK
ncbi:cysteine-rich repeat secretory protein [Striga asiatica]|uniref:Cysteine-rich repeat secretory protein n=1 Tax=Striga asiatica TaxID=4170 RepID=A0A5A7QTB2_STRAF|nr:cysteine-rich repeat secretory protein [Striga asiatica]